MMEGSVMVARVKYLFASFGAFYIFQHASVMTYFLVQLQHRPLYGRWCHVGGGVVTFFGAELFE